MTNTNQQPQQVNIQLGEKESEGIYANLAIISHSPAEFIIDFTRVLPGVPRSKVYSRIIMTPQHTKSLLKALQDNINKYEAQFGEIKVISEPEKSQPIGFQAADQTGQNQPEQG